MVQVKSYIYHYAYPKGEAELCALEQRAFFGQHTSAPLLESSVEIPPNRSPFMKERVDVWLEAENLDQLRTQVSKIEPFEETFKTLFVKHLDGAKVGFNERRQIEREIGLEIPGNPDLDHPQIIFAIMFVNGRWVFGRYVAGEAVWLRHQQKPNGYSTALSTRVARAVMNIAVPNPDGVKAIDPCCGIGTVVVEGRSMGIDIIGSDVNPLILPGGRENLAYFGLKGELLCRDIRDVTGSFDVAIIDMPYNLCSVLSEEDQLEMLQHARQFTKKIVIVTIEHIDHFIEQAGFEIIDRCLVKKGHFIREVIIGH